MNKQNPVFLMAQLSVPDQETYVERYAMPVVAQLNEIGATVLAVCPEPEVLEGEWPRKWTVLIEFPSDEVAKKWYESPEYQPFKSMRMNEVTDGGNLVLVPRFDPSQL